MQVLKKITLAAALCAMSSLALADGPVVPTGTFGAADVPNDFGGHGISTDAVQMATFANGLGALYLSATPRYDPPLLSNDGAGTFGATAGTSLHEPRFGFTNLSLWNFDWEVKSVEGYNYTLYIDTDAGAGTLFSAYTALQIGFDTAPDGTDLPFWDSSNLGYFTSAFNPEVGGEYGFVLQATDALGNIAATSAILVEVAGPDGTVPEPASIALVGLALGAAGFASRRRNKA